MDDLLKKFHAWLISGTDRQLFRRSLVILLILAVFVQIGLNTGHWLSYLAAFGVGVAYAYLWIELFKRFASNEDKTKNKDTGKRKEDPKE
ncbi:hypothetical protein [Marinimicrobium sp. ABcell2]|uniref:hypothetical protein n=1 Tax=Marinimicrobium sp. ABcell2 TaxID=3069751 RepID=UPI0027AEFCB5|nr:hypothetical protein [Marinimicrobium sp. ABcell2]MDQ2075612.1 hypothetical protein [Marinimicrobium sp. ABcell2]